MLKRVSIIVLSIILFATTSFAQRVTQRNLLIQESDGSPSGVVRTLNVNNGSLSNDGSGEFTLSIEADDVTYENGETVEHLFDDTINAGELHNIAVTDEGGINISWASGVIWDNGNNTLVTITAQASTACTDDNINYLYWDRSGGGTALTLSTTRWDASDNDVPIATITVQNTDIWDIHEENLLDQREHRLSDAIQEIVKIVVTDGLVVSEDTDVTNAFDVEITAGTFYHFGNAKHTLAAGFNTRTTAMKRWYHSSGAWTNDTNASIDTNQYDNLTDLAEVTDNKYYKSVFMYSPNMIHWIYPQVEYDTVAQAIQAPLPTIPSVGTYFPYSVAVILRGNDTAFPTAGGSRWIDVRPTLGASALGAVTDHGSLAGLADDDHTQYLELDGSDTMTGDLIVGNGSTDAGSVKILEDTDDGSNSTEIKGQAFANDYILILPDETGSAGQVLEIASVDSNTMTLEWDTDDGAGAAGTVTTLEEGDAQVGDADIVTIDFGAGFDLAEDPDTEVNITMDLTEYTGDIGAATGEAGDIYLGDGKTLKFGADQDIPMTHVADTGLQFELDDKLMFGDTAVYIHSDDDGYLDIEADTQIRLLGPTTIGDNTFTATGTVTLQDAEVEIPNGSSDKALATAGEMHLNTTDEQLSFHSAADGEISGEVSLSLLKHWSTGGFDPGLAYDSDTEVFLFTVDDFCPEGLVMTELNCSCNVDPDVEMDMDLRYADAWIGLANAADIDEMDTTNGVFAEDTNANINSGNAIANSKVVYIGFDADPEGTCVQLVCEGDFYCEED